MIRFFVEVDETTDQGRQIAERLAAGDQVQVFFNVLAPSLPPLLPEGVPEQFTPDEVAELERLLMQRGLSERQAQIVLLDAQGCSRGDIAEQLIITERTVKWHWGRIYELLNVANRHEVRALLWNLRRG